MQKKTDQRPAFVPKPGQIDYTRARWTPVVNCVLRHGGEILLVQRSESLNFYPGCWNGISGFLDDGQSLEEKVRAELSEELGLGPERIRSIRLGQIFDQEEPSYKKTWIVHPVLVEVDGKDVTLDWEAKAHRWMTMDEASSLELLPGFDRVLRALSALI